jgi:hypothetical protein
LRGVASRIAVDVWEARFVKSRKGRWPGSMAPLRSPSTEEPPPSEHPPRRLNWVPLREFSSAVIEKAEAVVHLIIDTYFTPTRVFRKFAN